MQFRTSKHYENVINCCDKTLRNGAFCCFMTFLKGVPSPATICFAKGTPVVTPVRKVLDPL